MVNNFRYFEGIREDVTNMISEIGIAVSIKVPTIVKDFAGNHVSTSFTTYTETLWIRNVNEVMVIEDIGEMNRDDIRFEASYDSHIDVETVIVYDGNDYTVVSLDKPASNGSGAIINRINLVGYAKKRVP